MKVLIIGGVAGGATAAARLRRLDENAQIIVIERSGFISYANCGLPYYIGGVIEDREALTLQTPESFWRRFRIEARVRNEALSIDPRAKTVRIRRLDDGAEYTETYDKLILSPGANAVRPPFPGADHERIVTLRTVEDALRIRSLMERISPKRAVVIGGGFIGLEAAENLMHAGVETLLIERDAQVIAPIDYDMACQVHAYLRGKGLDLRLGASVGGFAPVQAGRVSVLVQDQEPIQADLVVMAVGIAPDTRLAKEAGLTLGVKGAIVVDERMQTSDRDIYAVGDAVEVRHYVSGEKTLLSLAGPANKQGRIAADNLCGLNSRFDGSQGSSIVKIFDMTVASTGLNEKAARRAGLRCDAAVTLSPSHATYYPGFSSMTVKTLFEPESGKILGAQIVGFDGVDKRIDVLSTAIRAYMTGADLAELDLAYAPPYSSAKDPVNMAGFMIENLRAGLVSQYHWHEIAALAGSPNALMLDTRTPAEYARGHIPGARNIPLDELRERLGELDRKKTFYVNCQSGLRSYIACRILTQHGFACHNLSGGYGFYEHIAGNARFDEAPAQPCGIKQKDGRNACGE